MCDNDRQFAEIDYPDDWSDPKYNWKVSPKTVQTMDEYFIEIINKTVGSGTLLDCGDFTFGNPKRYLDRLKCKIIHINGNHDDYKYRNLFGKTYDLFEFNYKNTSYVASHYAMAVWNKSHRGSHHVYGHSHAQIEGMMNEKFPERKSMDVGIDNAFRLLGEYRPFSMEEVHKYLGKK